MLSKKMIWSKAMVLLENQMTETSYENWITPLVPLRIEGDDVLVLLASSPLHRDTLESFFTEKIEKSLTEVAGTALSARFVTEDDELKSGAGSSVRKSSNPTLIGKYTFDTFVRGESNRFAYAAACAVAENPSEAYNPLFIYGGVGLGKTHLMHAIGHYIENEHPDFRIRYTSSENFTNDVILSIERRERAALRKKYRDLDVLLIDDIQFIGGKEATEIEFFNVFNDLHATGKQIVISSDKPPKEVAVLEERLRTRFGCGLVADIQAPDYETRLAILRKKANEDAIDVEDAVLGMIAEGVDTNIRDLEGCLNRIAAYTKLINRPFTATMADTVLKEYISGSKTHNISGDLIKQVVCDYFGITTGEIESNRRDRRFAYPRQIAMYLSRALLDSSYQEIGMMYGNRHYSTVMHSCEQIENLMPNDQDLKKTVDDLGARIKNG